MIRPFIDAAGVLRPTPMELYAAMRAREELHLASPALDAEQPPEGGVPRPVGPFSTQEAGKNWAIDILPKLRER